jgi:nickel-dependent lactate racemase
MTDSITTLSPEVGAPDPAALSAAVETAVAGLGAPASLRVLVNDPQRGTDSSSVLHLLTRLVPARRISLLVATGSHRFPLEERAAFERALAAEGPFRRIEWHDARAPELRAIPGPRAWRGHPRLLADEPLLAVGSVEPHYFAGFTGAHKTATIGCAGYEDIESNHAAALGPCCRPCALAGNPVHEGVAAMLAGLEACRPVAAVNLLQAGEAFLAAAGGGALESLQALRGRTEAVFVRRIDRPADALIAEVSGPLAVSFYQAEKGIKNSEWAVRDGGCVVLVAACPGGVGQDHFVRLLREAPTHKAAAATVASRGYRLGDHKAVRLRYLTDPACRGVRVFVVSPGLSQADATALGVRKAATAQTALTAAGVNPSRDRVYRVRDAANVCVLADK